MNRDNLKLAFVTTLIAVPIAVIAALAVVFVAQSVEARPMDAPSVPSAITSSTTTISYQGKLNDSAGNPLTTTVAMQFKLYGTDVGGSPLWQEVQPAVPVENGLFQVLLGAVTPVPVSLMSSNPNLWLGVTVGGDSEMVPREKIASVPYAMFASSLVAGTVISGTTSNNAALTVENTGDGNGISSISNSNGNALSGKSLNGGASIFGDAVAPNGIGVYGYARASTNGGFGVKGDADNGIGVYGTSIAGETGVYGWSLNSVGVTGYASNGIAVKGNSGNPGTSGNYAGWFNGQVYVNGTLSKNAGSFKIDHPLDPANKYLYHSFVESPDMMNIYNGNVTLDTKGEAWVEMPEWFDTLNKDFRYQLTCIGDFAPVYIAQKMQGNRFKIAGGKPGIEVSWMVTGIRHDPYADKHRIPVEEDKSADEKGYYLHPDLYNQPDSKSVENARLSSQPKP